jgi:hypothetical protein
MVQLIATLFFAGILVGLALVLQFTVRDHWQDMVAAFFGRPLPSRAVKRQAQARVSVPRSRRLRAAA